MKARWLGLLLLVAATLSAQRAMTVAQVVTFVGSQVKMKGDDRATADFLLHKVKLTEKLEARVVEELQGQGAGPKTVQALKKLIDESAALPAAPPAETVAAPPPPPPAPSAAEQAEILAAIKDYALNYTNNLPNYMCIQTTRRKIHPTVSGYIPYGDVIREELSFVDHKETYKVLMRNEQSVVNIEHNQLGGAISNGEFGTMLAHIFDPATGAEFDWDHWATLRSKRMYVFRFKVPKSAGYSMVHGGDRDSRKEYTSAYQGLIYADRETKVVMRIKMDCVDIPKDYPIKTVGITLDYDYIKIGGETFVLPFHFELNSTDTLAIVKNEADYKLYRKFGAESAITFDSEPVPEDQLKEQPDNGGDDKPKPPPVKKQNQ
jgi:hypothetical protein